MQSFLAFRRFGKLVKRQLERDTQKAEALARGNNTAQCPNSENRLPTSPLREEEGNREIVITQEGKGQGHRRSSIETDSSITAVPGNGIGNGNGDLAEDGFPDSRDVEKGEHAAAPTSAAEVDGKAYGENEGDGDEIAEDLERRPTHKTTRSFGTAMGITMTGIEVRQLTREMTRTRSRTHNTSSKLKRQGKKQGESEEQEEKETVFVVGYESSTDPMDPHNWPYTTRILATSLIASIGFIVGFASAIDSAALKQASTSFDVSPVAESLATGIFLIGFGIGALFAGPISETVGRNPVYIITIFIYMCWILGAALAPNLATQLVMRFLAGFFGSTPLVCAGGSISDLWDPFERVFAFPAFANAAFMGPIFGPVVGGFIGQSTLVSWRWTEWITLILSGVILVAVFLFQPETYAPILLKWKAKQLRKLTGDERYVSLVEIRADTFTKRLLLALYRPFILTFKEPIVMLFSLYLTVIYIILFTFLDGYTYIFGDTYGFSEGITGLAFIGIAIGLCFASLLVPLIHYWAKRDLLKLQETQGDAAKLPPEFRLWFAMLGAPAIPISLFWMGWTTYPHISYWSPLISSVVFGYGILCIFISTYQYIIDSYELYAASALAGVTFIRYVASGGMVEVGIPFYENLGVHWTLTILGAISAVIAPVPYAFFKWGPTIRKHSKYAAGMKGLD